MTVILPKAAPLRFPLPHPETDSIAFFDQKIREGLKFRNLSGKDKVYKNRIRYERKIIIEKDFVDYFLITSDLVVWAKENGIPVGPGRGSAAGSLICYLLRITEIDPVPTPMMFERFIDPTRNDMPDIDIDFADDRRDEVFNYAREKYGSDCVANIGAFTRYKGKNSIDDIARVYHVPQWQSKLVKDNLLERPDGHPRVANTIEDSIDTFKIVADVVKERPELKKAMRLEGNYRNLTVHAAGLAISSVPFYNICAVYTKDGRRVIPYDKYDAKHLGILKFDILSLKTLGMIAHALDFIGMSLNHLYSLPPGEDAATMEAFAKADTLGIFQFEGGTTARICKAVQPSTIGHLSDINALSRPGPLGAGTDVKYANDKKRGTFAPVEHDIVAKHTKYTYGHIIYQEQILRVLAELGNFPPEKLNEIRSIIQLKLGEGNFNKLYGEYLKGAIGHGCTEQVAESIWNKMVNAAGYAFNIAHSWSYATLAYWQMWLKVHHPTAFYAAQLIKNGDGKDDIPRRTKIMQAAVRNGIEILPPDPVKSGITWTLDKQSIIAGFSQIDGLGETKSRSIIAYRECPDDGKEIKRWKDLKYVSGIGSKTIERIEKFCELTDPFGINHTHVVLDRYRKKFQNGELQGIWAPTHTSILVPQDGSPVVYMGVARKRKYFDAVVQAKKKSKEPLTTEEVLKNLKDPDKLKYAIIDTEDDYGESIVLFVSRWVYPKFANIIENLQLGKDILVAKGKGSDFFGGSVKVESLTVLRGD